MSAPLVGADAKEYLAWKDFFGRVNLGPLSGGISGETKIGPGYSNLTGRSVIPLELVPAAQAKMTKSPNLGGGLQRMLPWMPIPYIDGYGRDNLFALSFFLNRLKSVSFIPLFSLDDGPVCFAWNENCTGHGYRPYATSTTEEINDSRLALTAPTHPTATAGTAATAGNQKETTRGTTLAFDCPNILVIIFILFNDCSSKCYGERYCDQYCERYRERGHDSKIEFGRVRSRPYSHCQGCD